MDRAGKQYDVTTHCQETQHKNQRGWVLPSQGHCYGLGKLDGDIVLSFARGTMMRPVTIQNGVMWVDMLYAGIGVPAPTSGHVGLVSLCMSLIPFMAYTNTVMVALNNTCISEAVCHPMCTYEHSMHISPLYSTNDTVFNIVFGPLFCNGGLFIILFISS